jgi:hypothetical protein
VEGSSLSSTIASVMPVVANVVYEDVEGKEVVVVAVVPAVDVVVSSCPVEVVGSLVGRLVLGGLVGLGFLVGRVVPASDEGNVVVTGLED